MPPARAIPLPNSARRPGLDVLRAAATILVVMLHAAVPYIVAPMPGLAWPVRNTVVSPVVDLLFWGIEGAIMPLFFVLSGYGAAQTLTSRPRGFLSTRWRRLGWPLLAAAAIILPVELYVWLIGWAADGQIPWQKLRSLKLGPYHNNLWGLSHLWYLEYLLIYSAALWAGDRYLGVQTRQAIFRRARPWLALRAGWLAALAMAVLWVAPEVVVGFQHGFLPFPMKLVFSGLFFVSGVLEFHRPSRFLPTVRSTCAVAGCLLIGLLPLIHRQTAQSLIGLDRSALAAGLAIYAVLVTQASWQWAITSQISPVPSATYLSQASFWIYLVHHPLVASWQIGLRSTGWPALIQFGIVTLGTMAVSLASYEWLVRGTSLAAFLEGRRPMLLPVEATPPAPVEVPIRRAA